MPNTPCEEMPTRSCPGNECPTLGCARFSREADEWTDDETATFVRRFEKTLQSQHLSSDWKENYAQANQP